MRATYLVKRNAGVSAIASGPPALLAQLLEEGCGYRSTTFAPYVYYATCAVTSAGVCAAVPRAQVCELRLRETEPQR